MTRTTKISLIAVAVLLLGSLPTIMGLVRAYSERSKISPGMSADDVFMAADEWNLCLSSYRDSKTQKFEMFSVAKEPDGQVYRVTKYDKTFRSKPEFLEFVDQQMSNGQAWNTQLTYFAGPLRNTYRVDFDASGRVVNVSGMVGAP